MRFDVSPRVPLALAALGTALVTGGTACDGASAGARLVAVIAGLSMAIGMTATAARRRGWVEIAHTIVWCRGRCSGSAPLAAARAVRIERRPRGMSRPTDYLLELEVDGRTHRLLLGQHWLAGRGMSTRAEELAARLAVPLHDPIGLRLRASNFALARWVVRGEEWRVAVPALLVGGLVAVWVGL